MTTNSTFARLYLWPIALALATAIGSYGLACVFPFAAFATLAALTMDRKAGLALVGATWAANQFVGFFLLSFPWDAQAVGHGIAILLSTGLAFESARFVSRSTGPNPVIGGALALVSAFGVYEAALWLYAQLGGGTENFTPAIISEIALNDGIWFAGLLALRFLITKPSALPMLPAFGRQ